MPNRLRQNMHTLLIYGSYECKTTEQMKPETQTFNLKSESICFETNIATKIIKRNDKKLSLAMNIPNK